MKTFSATVAATSLLFASCASYVTPGRQADLSVFTDARLKKAYTARPAIQFPAHIAVVRIQETGYVSESAKGVGAGAYSVVTTRDIERAEDIDRLSRLPGIGGVVALNRLLLPKHLSTDLDLREAASKLQTDAMLIYTLATEFSDSEVLAPLTTLSLGLAPNKQYKVRASASAILMDTRTGYIYGALEEGHDSSGITISWGSLEAMESARKKAERQAFEKLLASFTPFWTRIHSRFQR